MTVSLDLAAAVELQKRLSSGAFFTGLMLYLEGLVAFVLLTENALAIASLIPIAIVIAAQFLLVRHPAQLLVAGRLAARYRAFVLLALVFVVLTALGGRAEAPILAALVVGATAWPAIAAMRAADGCRAQLRALKDPAVLLACMSFEVRSSIERRLRSFGGDRVRWGTPFAAGIAAGAACLVLLALVQQGFGLRFGALIGQAAGLTGIWVFYRSMRHTKPRAAQLRERDTRPPVLVLREFEDDALMTARLNPGRSFEHFFTAELDRIGPTISVGRPGERLAPLGAARDYLENPDWQSEVGTMIEDAGVVTFVLGDSTNLLWEFRRAMASGGRARTLIIVPPLEDLDELRRRWTHFARETVDGSRTAMPRDMPAERVLAIAFAGDDVVMFAGPQQRSARSWFSKVPMDYRLALRLFGCLREAQPSSANDVAAFVRANLPIVQVRSSD